MATFVIHLHPSAPAKPKAGAACNGCGVCCAWQPCPLGMLISGRRHGACDALRWDAAGGHYRCAMVSDPQAVLPRLPGPPSRWLQRLARRWIAAGAGCDCDVDAVPAEADEAGPA